MNEDAYKEGKRNYHRNKGVYSNPYEKSDTRHDFYERGWFQAQKRAPECLDRSYEKEQAHSTEVNRTNNEQLKQLQKEAYLNRKG